MELEFLFLQALVLQLSGQLVLASVLLLVLREQGTVQVEELLVQLV